MRLVAIYNAWSDCLDLLAKSITNIIPVVDAVIVVWSNKSNNNANYIKFDFVYRHPKVSFHQAEPIPYFQANQNETMKRNIGIEQAKREGFTHFLIIDSDEFYHQEDVIKESNRIEREDLNGLVCGLRVYIKKPTLWCEDHTLVPFIQKITKEVSVGDHKLYPYAYDRERRAHIDPTRRPSHKDKIGWSEVIMHHFSWVRKDLNLKINNSTASANIKRSTIYKDIEAAAPGIYNEFYRDTIKECEDVFNIEGA